MRVAFITRSTLYAVPGGDTTQVEQTALHLQAIGIQTEIKLTDEEIDYDRYDLLHFFNLIRPADIIFHIRQSGKPYVVSSILCDYTEYDKYHRKGLGRLFNVLSSDGIEYVKTMARFLLGRDKLMSRDYTWRGHHRSVLEVLKKTAMVLPNSESEYRRLLNNYGGRSKYIIVPNGIDQRVFSLKADVEKDEELVICVARIEGRKNQLNLIRALNGTRFKLVLIGKPAPNQVAYYNECRRIAAGNVRFMDRVPIDELLSCYAQAKVHVLPSWFETTGLSSVEAAAMGCNVVVTDKGDVKEYFEEDAFYCQPSSPQSILEAVENASRSDFNEHLRQRILRNFTWQQAAKQTLKAYQLAIA